MEIWKLLKKLWRNWKKKNSLREKDRCILLPDMSSKQKLSFGIVTSVFLVLIISIFFSFFQESKQKKIHEVTIKIISIKKKEKRYDLKLRSRNPSSHGYAKGSKFWMTVS